MAGIDCYQAILPGDGKQPEQRVVSHRLVPMPALGELAAMLNSMREALQKAAKQQGEQEKS